MMSFSQSLQKARSYGLGEYLEIVGELSQESTKKGALDRKSKELITLGIAMYKQCHRCIDIHKTEAERLGASEHELSQVRKIVLYLTLSPGEQGQLRETLDQEWKSFAISKGPVKHCMRELLALSIALVKQSRPDIKMHIESAFRHGGKAEEILEVLPIALLMDGAPVLSQIPALMEEIEVATQSREASVSPAIAN